MDVVDALLIAAPKAGTTGLYNVFKKHPGIALPAANDVVAKEPHYFSQGVFSTNYGGLGEEILDFRRYESLFRTAKPGTVRCDLDPHTMYGPRAIELVKGASRHPKLMVVLRNPVDRAYSHYIMDARECIEERTFGDAIRQDWEKYCAGSREYCPLVRLGFYAEPLSRFVSAFGKEAVRIWLYDDLVSQPDRVLREMWQFLGVADDVVTAADMPFENRAGVPRNWFSAVLLRSRWGVLRVPRRCYLQLPHRLRSGFRRAFLVRNRVPPPMDSGDRRFLQQLFCRDIFATAEIAGRDLSHWLK